MKQAPRREGDKGTRPVGVWPATVARQINASLAEKRKALVESRSGVARARSVRYITTAPPSVLLTPLLDKRNTLHQWSSKSPPQSFTLVPLCLLSLR